MVSSHVVLLSASHRFTSTITGAVSFVGIDLITVEARVIVASLETYLKYADAFGHRDPITTVAKVPAGGIQVQLSDRLPAPAPRFARSSPAACSTRSYDAVVTQKPGGTGSVYTKSSVAG